MLMLLIWIPLMVVSITAVSVFFGAIHSILTIPNDPETIETKEPKKEVPHGSFTAADLKYMPKN